MKRCISLSCEKGGKTSLFFLVLIFILFSGYHSGRDRSVSEIRIWLDGAFDDWNALPVQLVPCHGRSHSLLQEVAVINDSRYLYLKIDLDKEINLQRRNSLTLWLDLDNDAQIQCGKPDLSYCFGKRTGYRYAHGTREPISQSDLLLRSMPTFSSRTFELLIPLTTLDSPRPGQSIGIALTAHPDSSADLFSYQIKDIPYKSHSRSMTKHHPEHIRILVYNVLFDGLFKKPYEFQRLFQAIQADIVLLLEVYDHSAQQVLEWWHQAGLCPDSTRWNAFGHPGKVLVSRFPITDSLVFDQDLYTLIALSDNQNIWIVNSHLACCDNDSARMQKATALMNRLIAAQQAQSSEWMIRHKTPIILAGDFNLVGYASQFHLLKNGTGKKDAEHGLFAQPDWDGTALADVRAFHLTSRDLYTWRDDKSEFSPGRLDFIFYTDSVFKLANRFVLWTPNLTDSLLHQARLERMDSAVASDHLPLVADFELRQ